jgi:hypothetical protein
MSTSPPKHDAQSFYALANIPAILAKSVLAHR